MTFNHKRDTIETEKRIMVSVIATGGQQYIVAVGKKMEVKKIKNATPGQVIEFKDLLNPKKTVFAKVIDVKKGKKTSVMKYKNKSRYMRRLGHRQDVTAIEILSDDKKADVAKKSASVKKVTAKNAKLPKKR